MRALVKAERPQDAFLGEERGQEGRGARRWIVDAIDDMVANDPERTTLAGGWNGAVNHDVALVRPGLRVDELVEVREVGPPPHEPPQALGLGAAWRRGDDRPEDLPPMHRRRVARPIRRTRVHDLSSGWP